MANSGNSIFEKIGLPKNLKWGYLGILIFMMGDGIEQGWLSPYLTNQGGLSLEDSALVFTVYGVTIAISSWLSGVMADTYGVRKTMFIGLVLYCLGVAGFTGLGLQSFDYPIILLTYGFKGLGYPLFAYTFMVWIAYKTPRKRLSTAQGWFWFVFTGGLNVLGTYYSRFALSRLGPINLLYTAIIFALTGALFALLLNPFDKKNVKSTTGIGEKLRELCKGFTILKREPKVLLAGIVRTINTTPQFAFLVFLPAFMARNGFPEQDWLFIWGTIFIGNILFNVLYGALGDKIGWRKTIIWFGAISAAIGVLLFFYSAIFSNNIYVVTACGLVWSIALAGFVPLSALTPSLVKEDKGSAVSILNLGAGLPVFVGPALVGIFHRFIGDTGLIWLFASLYVTAAILTVFIVPRKENQEPGVKY